MSNYVLRLLRRSSRIVNKPLRGAEGDNPCCREGLLDKEYDRMQQGVTFKQQVYIQDMLAKVMRKLGIPRRSSRSGACTRKRETHAKLAVSSKGGVDSSPALSACGRSHRFFFRPIIWRRALDMLFECWVLWCQEAQLHGEIDLRKHVDRLVANERHRRLGCSSRGRYPEGFRSGTCQTQK